MTHPVWIKFLCALSCYSFSVMYSVHCRASSTLTSSPPLNSPWTENWGFEESHPFFTLGTFPWWYPLSSSPENGHHDAFLFGSRKHISPRRLTLTGWLLKHAYKTATVSISWKLHQNRVERNLGDYYFLIPHLKNNELGNQNNHSNYLICWNLICSWVSQMFNFIIKLSDNLHCIYL